MASEEFSNRHKAYTVVSKDGSHTLFSEQFDQHYHNPNGAVDESIHVFFQQSGLIEALKEQRTIHIFEMGFGTSLNFILLADMMLKMQSPATVVFQTVEAYPISKEVAEELNYAVFLSHPELMKWPKEVFGSIQKGQNEFHISDNLKLKVFYGLFDEMPQEVEVYDFYIFDAFSPEVNAELWSAEVFDRLRLAAKPNAVLSTYCAATSARAAMAMGGWLLARARGALGKREMTIAAIQEEALEGKKRLKERRLIERWQSGEFDKKK